MAVVVKQDNRELGTAKGEEKLHNANG